MADHSLPFAPQNLRVSEPRSRAELAELQSAHRATLLLIGGERRLAARRDEVAELVSRLDAGLLCGFWQYHRVLSRAVQRAGLIGVTDGRWAEADHETRLLGQASGAVQDLTLAAVTKGLERAGVDVIAFKGRALARQLYEDPLLRQVGGDIDLLVNASDLDGASRFLEERAWLPASDPLTNRNLPDLHLRHPHIAAGPVIEVHWRTHRYDDDHAGLVLARLVRDNGIPTPDPIDTLVILLLCFARDGLRGLKLASDVAAWWDRYGRDVTVADVGHRVANSPLEGPVNALLAATGASLGSPVDPQSMSRRSGVALRLIVGDRPLPARQASSQRAVVDVLMAPPGKRCSRFFDSWWRPRAPLTWWPRRRQPPTLVSAPFRALTVSHTALQAIDVLRRARRCDTSGY